jgi:hypothetical protein
LQVKNGSIVNEMDENEGKKQLVLVNFFHTEKGVVKKCILENQQGWNLSFWLSSPTLSLLLPTSGNGHSYRNSATF